MGEQGDTLLAEHDVERENDSVTDAAAALPFRFGPRQPSGFSVLRKDLLRHLTEASLVKQLSIVRGPAGSGKTTLLAQWRDLAGDMGRPTCWLTPDSADRDIASFVGGLAEALELAGCATIATGLRDALDGIADRPIAQTVRSLAGTCNLARETVVIALDRYEAMNDPRIGELLAGLLEQTARVRLVIASRVRPAIPLGGLRARDQLFEIGPSELNLTAEETRAVFGEAVPDLYTRRLHLETSGEAVAVGFARRVLDATSRDVVGAESWHDQLHDYYRAEVLDTLSPEWRGVLCRLLVVERFDLSLARALAGVEVHEPIERLHTIDGLLLRHRGTQEYYFPEMLRRFLEHRLSHLGEIERMALHQRAATWFSRYGRHSEALRHATAAGAGDLAIGLLERIGYASLIGQQGVQATQELLDAIGGQVRAPSVGTLLSTVWIHGYEGDAKAALVRLDEAKARLANEREPDPAVIGQLALVEAFITALRDETAVCDTTSALEDYLRETPAGEHAGRAQAHVFLSWDRFCRGDVIGAHRLTDAAAADYGETEGVYGYLFLHVHRVLARFWENDLEAALTEICLADRMACVFFPDDQRLRAMTAIFRSSLSFELGRADPLLDTTSLVGTIGAIESWSEIQIWAHTHGAATALVAGRLDEARAILSYGREVAERLDSPRLDWAMRLALVDTSIRLGDMDRAWDEARALDLPGAAFLASATTLLTWQERIGGLLTLIRLLVERGDLDEAERAIAIAESAIAATNAARCRTALELAKARFHQVRGRSDAAQAAIAAARASAPGMLPIRLFADTGAALHQYLTEIPSWNPPAAQLYPQTSLDQRQASMIDPLTPRERQILLFMGEGHPNKVAAHRLGLSEATVKFHLRNIYRKLRAQNRTQALARYRALADGR